MNEEESKRVSLQVTSLSTKLLESIEKQNQLEGQIGQLEKENSQLKEKSESLNKKLQEVLVARNQAEDEVSNLSKEVEELSSSLFDEANKMVSNAKREAHDYQMRNNNLISQLKEKDLMMETLQNQLTQLKDVLLERDSAVSTTDNSSSSLTNQQGEQDHQQQSPQQQQQPKQVLYSPTVNAVRFDLKPFNDFKIFTRSIKNSESIKNTETKFFKRLLTDDVEPALRLDNAPGISWLNRRSLMSYLIDGRVSIEPVSGINETYRVNFQQHKINDTDVKSSLYAYPPHSPPVAISEPCAVCGEKRDDILEHSRLYVLKVHGRTDSALSSLGSTSPMASNQYPLCSFCLFRVRCACDLFAFLRSLKTDVWDLSDDAIMKKSWIELSRLRSKLFWSKIGIWDLDDNLVTTRITPSTGDNVYTTMSNTVESAWRNSMYFNSSTESLVEKPSYEPSSPSNYKSSPLKETETAPAPQNPVSFIHSDSTEETVLKESTEDGEEPYNDILNNYSGDETEAETSQRIESLGLEDAQPHNDSNELTEGDAPDQGEPNNNGHANDSASDVFVDA